MSGCPTDPSPAPNTPLAPPQRRRRHSTEPQPFTGLSHTPRCAACEQATTACPKAPGSPPPRRLVTRGRRRTIATQPPCCPEQDCAYSGGADGAIFAPMAIREAGLGDRCSVCRVMALSISAMAYARWRAFGAVPCALAQQRPAAGGAPRSRRSRHGAAERIYPTPSLFPQVKHTSTAGQKSFHGYRTEHHL